MRLARLYALATLADRYHSGQWSQGYRIGCRARSAMLRLGIRGTDSVQLVSPRFRRAVAGNLRKYRHAFKRNG